MLLQNLIPESQYSTKCPYSMNPKGICVHNTANNASAKNERDNVARVSNTAEVSFHVAIDDVEAIQLIPFNRNTWHAGDGGAGEGNRGYIAIEICYSLSGGEKFTKAEQRATKEIALLLKQYEWTIANVKKHQDFSGKYCPHRTLDLGYTRFLNMVQAELDILNGKGSVQQPSNGELYRIRKTWADANSQIGAFKDLGNAKKSCKAGYYVFDEKGNKVHPIVQAESKPVVADKPISNNQSEYKVKEYKESGVFTCTENSIYFRNSPIIATSNPTQGQYFKGEKVIYDYVFITNKYTYISWISGSGVRRYMPVRDMQNKEVWGTFV